MATLVNCVSARRNKAVLLSVLRRISNSWRRGILRMWYLCLYSTTVALLFPLQKSYMKCMSVYFLFATVSGIFTIPPYCNTKQPLVKVVHQQELDQVTALPARITGRYINETSTKLVEALRYTPEGRGFDCRCGHLTQSFRRHYGPGLESASNRNEYQGYLLGVKAVRV